MPSDDRRWGNYVVANRSPQVWKEFGAAIGEQMARGEWEEFLFYGDAHILALTPKTVAKKADKEAPEELFLIGIEMHADYEDTSVSTKERKIWIDAFTKTYSEIMDDQVDRLIPPKLRKNLDLFCTLVNVLRGEMDSGRAHSGDFGGLRLAAKKRKEAEPEPTYRPTRKELRASAIKLAKDRLKQDWAKFMARRSTGSDFQEWSMDWDLRPPRNWKVSDPEGDYYLEVGIETYRKDLSKKALELAPASAWKDSYRICSLWDELMIQAPPKKEFVPAGASRPNKRFEAKRKRDDWEEQRDRQEWEDKTREKMRKDFERVAKRRERAAQERAAVAGAVLAGVWPTNVELGDRPALIIMHLSSLDTLTHEDPAEGEALADRLIDGIVDHDGPVIIADQGWDLGFRESRPRQAVLEAIADKRPDVVWIPFDEATEPWREFFPKLYQALEDAEATGAVVGGLWFDPSLHTGCATFTYVTIRSRIPAVVDEDLVGCAG